MQGEIAANLGEIRTRISDACARVGRSSNEVTLVAVSKTFGASDIDEAIAVGVTDIGENRVQEGVAKKADVTGVARWHLIGHLQTNKAPAAAAAFDSIHSIDSEALCRRLSIALQKIEKSVDVLIQVNVGDESQKSGIGIDEVEKLVRVVAATPALRPRGLMTIPPLLGPEETRPFFRRMRELRETLARELELENFDQLSMGMSNDYEIAIEEGSTMVRIGRAIFGKRS